MWIHVSDKSKEDSVRLNKLDDRLDTVEFTSGSAHDKITAMEKENAKLKDSVVYLQSQSMRNNLIFGNIPESQSEKPDQTEVKLRTFMHEKLGLAKELADSMKLDRVHRMGPTATPGGYSENCV